jgi:8-oxo-dGTP pyrophosphatase MutT (NUDIX family)
MPVESNHGGHGRPEDHILKIGLAVERDGCLLTVRKLDGEHLILPGGKLEPGETDQDALRREIAEELGCELVLGSIRWLGAFEDEAADAPLSRVTVRLYGGEIAGVPKANREIAALKRSFRTSAGRYPSPDRERLVS